MVVDGSYGGDNASPPTPALKPEQNVLRAELAGDVQMLADTIGERSIEHYAMLRAAADFIEQSFAASALPVRRGGYDVDGKLCENIEAEIPAAAMRLWSSARTTIPS